MSSFSEDELAQLSAQVDNQLQRLRQEQVALTKTFGSEELEDQLAPQMEAIAQSTQTPPRTVLQKIHRVVKRDLCEDGGLLHEQWKKFGDLNNKDVLKQFETALMTAFGLSDHKLAVAMVAVTVIVLHLGARAFCEEFGQGL